MAKLSAAAAAAQEHVDARQGQAMIIGVMEHIEEAGIHSGDSACSLPPYSLPKEIVRNSSARPRNSPGRLACAA